MPDVTPIYNWPIPEDTDLVKDGAEAIRDLAGAIETTVDSSPTGLIHINTTSFSGVAEQQFNNVFSSTYDDYRIIGQVAAASQSVIMRLRTGSNDAGANYAQQEISSNNTTIAGARATGQTFWTFSITASTQTQVNVIDIINPNIASNTYANGSIIREADGTLRQHILAYNLQTSTQYTGFSLLPQTSGNIAGKISVYGYRKS